MNEKDRLNKLYKDGGLTKDDIFKHKHFKIITRSGIEKIQYKNKIQVTFQPIVANEKIIVIKAIAGMGTQTLGIDGKPGQKVIETFGEWNDTHIKRDSKGEIIPYYPAALAEKRALSRAVLKIMNLYEYDFLGEDEEIFEVPASDGQIEYIRSLMGSSVYEEHQLEKLESEIGNLSTDDAEKVIGQLKANQKDPIASGDSYGQKEINEKLDRHE